MNVTERLAALRSAYVERNPASARQHEAACVHLPGGNTRSVLFYEPFPLAIVKGEGARLWDADGHVYTDLLGEFTAGLYGHSHPVIRAAIAQALESGLSFGGHNLLESRLADMICARITSMEQLRFTNSGTEANLMALAAALRFTRRRRILVFGGGYHGGLLTFAGGGSPVNVPHEFIVGRYNDLAGARKLVDENASQLAAILVEPIQGSAGCIPGEPTFLHGLREAADAAGALLIFDEVMSSRLAPGGRQQQLGIAPDLTTLGKYLGGGLTFGAFGGRAEVMAQFDPRRPGHLPHAGTFNNNVLTMAAGVAGLGEVLTPQALGELNARGDALRERLNARCRDRGAPMQFTGLGSLMNLHATARPIRSVEDLPVDGQTLRDACFFYLLERGYYTARRGFIALSLPLDGADLDGYAAAIGNFIDRL